MIIDKIKARIEDLKTKEENVAYNNREARNSVIERRRELENLLEEVEREENQGAKGELEDSSESSANAEVSEAKEESKVEVEEDSINASPADNQDEKAGSGHFGKDSISKADHQVGS